MQQARYLRAVADALGLCTGSWLCVYATTVAARMSDPDEAFSLIGAILLSLLFLGIYAALFVWRGNLEKCGLVILFGVSLIVTLLFILIEVLVPLIRGENSAGVGLVLMCFAAVSIATWTPALIFRGMFVCIGWIRLKAEPEDAKAGRSKFGQ